MKALTDQQLEIYKEVFPELTKDQIQIAILLALGVPEKNIADMRYATQDTIKKTILLIRKKYDVESKSSLLSVLQVKIFHTFLMSYQNSFNHAIP
ncbi:helix-turn-helix transcriptional regulator [Arsenophonus apicola]|uniref:Transcriptional regulator n=1 Tax=Arsenophonus apicola TaxID=2879119 RepID=A0ABY8P3X8_9GAMM|nr:transcriptional regulator [Arsenophonus apicola]WGO83059.1 transcriptional regulator [Arsenophonus apicola]